MRKKMLALVAAVALVGVPAVVAGQVSGQYDLSWAHLPGGGGTSSGGPYTVTGATGQAITGSSSGGSYAVASGFLAGGGGSRYRLFAPGVAATR